MPARPTDKEMSLAYGACPHILCDWWLVENGDRALLEGFIGAVWSGQIRADKRLAC